MSTIITYMFILMVLALIIGFYLGWILRRSSYKFTNEIKIDELMFREENLENKQHVHATKLENNLGQLKQAKESIQTQKLAIKNQVDYNKKLNLELDDFHNKETSIKNNINKLENKINQSSNNLKILVTNSDKILAYKTKIKDFETNIKNQNDKIDSIAYSITDLKHNKELLDEKLSGLKNSIIESKDNLDKQTDLIEQIHEEFKTKKDNVIDDINLTRYKTLNYKYALQYANEKIAADEEISFDTIDKIINKNEESSIFSNIAKKLFSKSAKYIKEER